MALFTARFSLVFRPGRGLRRTALLLALGSLALVNQGWGRACVWKVSSGGHTLYLAGSIHLLRGSDYPLPAAYDQAFNASSVLAFETDMRKMDSHALGQAAYLPRGTTLRQHLDPRVYAYIQQVIGNIHNSTEPEKKLERMRPWAVAWMLQGPNGVDGVSPGEGVDTYFFRKAEKAHKNTVGLVPVKEHVAVFGGMNDADGQAYLLITFIGLNQQDKSYLRVVNAWKKGDVENIDRMTREEYREVPSIRRRIITDRNRRWVSQIVQWLNSGQTYMVIAGSAHMVGDEGVPALLKAQGFQVEQL